MTALIKMPETLPAGTDRHNTFAATLKAVKALDETPLLAELTSLAAAHNANFELLESVLTLIGRLDHTTPSIEWELFETLCARGNSILAKASRCDRDNQEDHRLAIELSKQWDPRYEVDEECPRIPFMGDGDYVLEGRGRCRVTKTDEFISGERLYLIEPKIMEKPFWFQEYTLATYLVGKFN